MIVIQNVANGLRSTGVSHRLAQTGSGLVTRRDAATLQLPSPHFDVQNKDNVFEFLDSARRKLLYRDVDQPQVARVMRQIYGVLHLARSEREPADWRELVQACREHPIFNVLHEDPFTRRAFEKPRGYAGDAVLLDYIYDSEKPQCRHRMSWVGERIHRCTTNSSACRGVKQRRVFIAELIDRLAANQPGLEVFSVACGHAREADYSVAIRRRRIGRFVALDSDPHSLEVVRQDYGYCGIDTVETSARDIIKGRFLHGSFDLVYSSGLYDYLNRGIGQRLTERLFEVVKPGGYLLLTNFVHLIEVIGYMEVFMDWNLIYRDRFEMMELTRGIPEIEIGQAQSFTEENGNVIFLLIQRAID